MGQRGFALFAALLVLLLVSGLLLHGAASARAERQLAWNAGVEVRALAAGRGGVEHALLRLRDLQARTAAVGSDPVALFGAWNRVDTVGASIGVVAVPGGGRYRVEVRDAASRLPANFATAEELRRLFLALGAAESTAATAALSIVDHRERVGALASLNELREVPGIEELPEAWEESVTVMGDGHVNLNTASEPVLRALPGMTGEAVGWLLARRAAGSFLESLYPLESALSGPARAELQTNFMRLSSRATFEPLLLEITAIGWIEGARLPKLLRTEGIRAGATVQVVSSVEE